MLSKKQCKAGVVYKAYTSRLGRPTGCATQKSGESGARSKPTDAAEHGGARVPAAAAVK